MTRRNPSRCSDRLLRDCLRSHFLTELFQHPIYLLINLLPLRAPEVELESVREEFDGSLFLIVEAEDIFRPYGRIRRRRPATSWWSTPPGAWSTPAAARTRTSRARSARRRAASRLPRGITGLPRPTPHPAVPVPGGAPGAARAAGHPPAPARGAGARLPTRRGGPPGTRA